MTDLPLAPDKPPTQTETVEQAEERVLDALLAPPKVEKETKAPGDEPEPEKKAEPKAEKEQAEPAEDAGEEDDESADVEKAITSLRRAKIPQTVLKKMSNREIIAMSKDVTARQAEVDETYRELGELRKKSKELESRKESDVRAEPTEQPLPNDLTADLAKLANDLGDDAAKALGSIVTRMHAAGVKQSGEEAKALRTELASMSGLVERLMTKEIRGDLKERFPEVEDAKKWEKVKDKASTLAKTGDYAGSDDPMRDVFEDAARLVIGVPPATSAPKKESRAKELGQPASKSKQTPPAALSYEDREDAALDALLKGGSREKAREAYGQ